MKKLLLILLLVPMVSFGQVQVQGAVPTYENPNPQPIKVQVQNKTNPYARPANNRPVIYNNPAPLAAAESNNFTPLSINIEDYTHIAIVDVLNSQGKRQGVIFRRVINALKASKLTIVDPTAEKKKFRKNTFHLREIKNSKWLYLYYNAGYVGGNLTVSVVLKDYEENKVFEKSTTNVPWRAT